MTRDALLDEPDDVGLLAVRTEGRGRDVSSDDSVDEKEDGPRVRSNGRHGRPRDKCRSDLVRKLESVGGDGHYGSLPDQASSVAIDEQVLNQLKTAADEEQGSDNHEQQPEEIAGGGQGKADEQGERVDDQVYPVESTVVIQRLSVERSLDRRDEPEAPATPIGALSHDGDSSLRRDHDDGSCSEIVVQGECRLDGFPRHHLEAHLVDEGCSGRKGRSVCRLRRRVKGGLNREHGDHREKVIQQSNDPIHAKASSGDRESLCNDVAVRHELAIGELHKRGAGRLMARVGPIEQGDERAGVDEDRPYHRESPAISSCLAETFPEPESNRPTADSARWNWARRSPGSAGTARSTASRTMAAIGM
jgi:hypothetical protein